MKKSLLVVCWLLCSQLVIACGSSCGSTTEIHPGQQVLAPPSTSQTLYSVDAFDGDFLRAGWSTERVRFDSLIEDKFEFGQSQSSGFVTFDLKSTQGKRIGAVELGLFVIGTTECPATYVPTVWATAFLVPDSEYETWSACYTTTYPYGDRYYSPAGCSFPLSLENFASLIPAPLPYDRYNMQTKGDGWWVMNNPADFRAFLQSLDKRYVTFWVGKYCADSTGAPHPNDYKYTAFEDGGNHGGTGNRPYLKITYQE